MTLAVVLICLGLARLGVWQLDRLAARQARSASLAARLEAVPLTLPQLEGLDDSAYRRVVLRGRFDYAQELALVNQARRGQLGFHLVTPLVLEDGTAGGPARAVLVDRGWIPAPPGAGSEPQAWAGYREAPATALVEVSGWVRPPAPASASGGAALPGRLIADLDPARLQARVDRPLLPFVVVQLPEAGARGAAGAAPDALPYRQRPDPDLGDGVHVIAAVQWFAFSAIGGAGYLVFLHRQGAPRGAAHAPQGNRYSRPPPRVR